MTGPSSARGVMGAARDAGHSSGMYIPSTPGSYVTRASLGERS